MSSGMSFITEGDVSMKNRRVAITGLGCVSPLGNTTASTWQNLLAGKSGIAPIRNFDASGFPTHIAAEVKQFSPQHATAAKLEKYQSMLSRFALEAAHEAVADAKLAEQYYASRRMGVVVGSGMMTAEFEYLHRFQQFCAPDGSVNWRPFAQDDKNFFRLSDFGQTTSNSCLSLLAQEFAVTGYATSVHTACASGGQALGLALKAIRRGSADCIIAGGFDSMINPLGVSSFCLLGALSTFNDTPETASRPFDKTRNGFVLGEGAAFLVLEEWEQAKARGAHIYAELAGEGNSLSSYRITDSHPNGDGAIQAIERALHDAGVSPDQVDYINAHGTSTKMNDLSETNAIKAVFAERAYAIPISSTKSQTGHLIAAAGALEAVLTVKTIQEQYVPATKNRFEIDPECDLDYVPETPRYANVRAALSNSFGFGGSNSSVLFLHPEMRDEL